MKEGGPEDVDQSENQTQLKLHTGDIMDKRMPVQLHRPRAVNLDDPEGLEEMSTMVEQTIRHTAATLPRMPDYVSHHPQVDEVGRLSAEALAMSYESAAKEIEAMGNSLADELKLCEQHTVNLVRELQRVREETAMAVQQSAATAQAYRDEAKALFDQVQGRSIAAAKVREVCRSIIEKDIKTS